MLVHALLLLVSLPDNSRIVLSGTVLDANGKSVAGAMVVVAEGPPAVRTEAQRDSLAAPRAPDVLATATSDNSGEFNIAMPDEMPEIAWRRTRLTVWCYHPNHALAVRLIDRDWPRAGLPLTIRLPVADNVRFKTTDAGYQPVPHARVAPLRVAGHLVPAILRDRLIAETDENGRAMLAGITPADLETVRLESQTLGVQWIGLPGQDRDKIILLNLAPVGRVAGQLTAGDPRAVARRTLRFATWQIPGDEHSGGGLAKVSTDHEGKFEVPALAAGSLTFEIQENGLPSPSPSTLAASKGDAPDTAQVYLIAQTTGPPIDSGKTTMLEIPLRRAVRAVQEVRDEDSGAPIAGVGVSVRSWQQGAKSGGETDASGRLSIHILPGAASVTPVRLPPAYYDPTGGLRSAVEVADKSEAVALSPLQLARGVPLRGRVVDVNDNPLAGAEVVGQSVHAWTNARGEFTIDAVAPHTPVSLWASHAGAANLQPASAQPDGPPVNLIVDNKNGVSLEGRVLDAAGRPIAAAVVRVWATQTRVGYRGQDLGYVIFDGNDRLSTDAQGWFHTPRGLRSTATYSIEVTAPGMRLGWSESIEPGSSRTTRFADLILHAAPRLRVVSGHVLNHEGRAVPGATVWQSGDGPRRTQTTSDAEGRFQLGGLYDTPAFLFAHKDGCRLQGSPVAPADKTCQIILPGSGEPAPAMRTLPPALPIEEERELAMTLLEPSLPLLGGPATRPMQVDRLGTLARANPAKALEVADTVLTTAEFKLLARESAALALTSIDLDEALAIIAQLDQPYTRVSTCIMACDQLADAPLEDRTKLLDEALLHARAEPEAGLKARELGLIAVRWLDLGRRQRGVTLLREGQTLVEALPEPNETNLRLSVDRGAFAGALARIDAEAALRLLAGFDGRLLNTFRANVARGLADHNPAEAERLFRLIESPPAAFRTRLAPLARMAVADAPRAARLARTYVDLYERAFALGTVAHGLADKDRAGAATLLEDAYAVLEDARELGPTQSGRRGAALTAAALLPVIEKIDPTLVEGYLWRALSLREPWPAPSELPRMRDTRLADLAAMVARYDRDIARHLLVPLADRFRETRTEFSSVLPGLAMTDPRWAAELVWALPDVPAPPASNNFKLGAACRLARWLALPRHGFYGRWEQSYLRCDLRHPDTLDDVW